MLRRWGTQPLQGAAAFVSDTGVVTGSTGQRLSSCQVPATTVEVLTTSPVPDAPSQGNGNGNATQVTVRRNSADHPLPPTGTDPLSTTVRELLDDMSLPPAERRLCMPRS